MALTGEHADPVIDLVAEEQARPDGDDIVVETHDVAGSKPRRRAIVAGAVALVVVAAAIGIVAVVHNRGSGTTDLRAVDAARHQHVVNTPVARHPVGTKPVAKKPIAKKPANVVAPRVNPTTNVVTPPTAAVVTPTSAPTGPPANAFPPVQEPVSVLTWTATPASLTIAAGGHATLTVNVVNPTLANVTLGHPLSCAPVMRAVHGAEIGGAMCEQMAQVMTASQHLTQQYTIYATDTADASGAALAPGQYSVQFEGTFTVMITVTPKA